MKPSRIRKLAALLMLASAATQPAAGSVLPASALAIGLHGSAHAHSVSVVAEEGHLDLVLSHDERSHRDHDGAPDRRTPSLDDRDHVFHMTGDDAAGATPRRAVLAPAPPFTMAVASAAALAPARAFRSAPQRCARSSDLLKTVVLLI